MAPNMIYRVETVYHRDMLGATLGIKNMLTAARTKQMNKNNFLPNKSKADPARSVPIVKGTDIICDSLDSALGASASVKLKYFGLLNRLSCRVLTSSDAVITTKAIANRKNI